MRNTYKYLKYNETLLKFMDEEFCIEYLTDKYKKLIPSKEFASITQSTERLAAFAHLNNLWYPVAGFQNGVPYAYISHGSELVSVTFLDERMFEYIDMTYEKSPNNKMFLSQIYIREYNYQQPEPLKDLKRDMRINFTEKGGLTVTTNNIIRESSVKIEEEVMKAKHKVNVERNWQTLPAFGKYDYLLDYSAIINSGDLLKEINTNGPAPEADNMTDEEITRQQQNSWLPPNWEDIFGN